MLRPIDVIQKDLGIDLQGDIRAGVTNDLFPFVEYDGITFFRFPLDAERHNSKVGVQCGLEDYGFGSCLDGSIELILKDIAYRHEAVRGVVPHMHCDITPGDVVVEVGAYLGYYSMFFSKQVGPDGHVYSIEFQPDCFTVLQKNFQANFQHNSTAIHKGAWSEKGTKKAYWHKNQANSFRSDVLLKACHAPSSDFESANVETDALEGIFRDHNVPTIKLLTIQVNGAEVEALKGLGGASEQVENVFVAAPYGSDGGTNVEPVVGLLEARGFEITIEGKAGIFGKRSK